MKKFKKNTAIVLCVLIGIVMIIGFLFSYVPISTESKTFNSLLGSINVSSDISGGVYAEFDIVSENPTTSEIVSSMAIIREVFEEDGYQNVNVYAIGNSKIRVEVSYANSGKTYAEVYSDLTDIVSGAFALSSTSSLTSSSAVVLYGSEYVSDVKVYTSDSTHYITIYFNSAGQEQYEALLDASSTIYLWLGDYSQSISVSSVDTYESLTLSNTDYENLIALAKKVKLGCMSIELNDGTYKINTMSATLSVGGSSSSPEDDGFSSSSAFIVMISAFFIACIIILAVFAIKFGLFAVLVLISMLFNSYLMLIFMVLMPSFEVGFSVMGALVLGVALIYTYSFIFASRVKNEYNIGKSLNASLETAYKQSLPSLLISNISMLFASLILFAFSFGELTSASIVFCVSVFLSLLTNLFIIPLFIKICLSFKNLGLKIFMLKKRSLSFETVSVPDSEIEIEEDE